VLPLFKQAEDWEDGGSEFRGAGGPIRVERARNLHPVAAAFIDAGPSYGMPYLDDVNVPEPEGVGPMNLNVRDGTRCSPAGAYLRPVMGNQNLTVLTEALAVKLTLTGTRCTGLDFLLDGKLRSVGASRELILCARAIHTPRLLLLSGVGPHADLEHLGIETVVDLPGVGRNLQDHVWLRGLCFEAKHPLPAPNNNLGGSTCFWESGPALGRPDLMVLPVQVPLVSDEIAARYPIPPNAFVIFPCLVRPRSRGYLRMRTAEPNGPLEIQPNFLAEQADVDALATGVELGLDLASQPAYRDLIKRWIVPPRRMSREGINVKGVLFTVQKALPLFTDGGSIILNASIAASKGVEAISVYSATKAAVRSFARCWTTDLKHRKIRVNTLSPGPIETPIFNKGGGTREQSDELNPDRQRPGRRARNGHRSPAGDVSVIEARPA
jgi:choline dehydrogenase